MTTVLVAASLFAIATVFAAPTQAPPAGNPSFPLTGPTGPAGQQGLQGIQGASGVTTCRQQISSCYSPAYGGCSVSRSATSGWKMTGGSCEAQYNASGGGLHAWLTSSSDTSINCYCHDSAYATSGYCYALIYECQ